MKFSEKPYNEKDTIGSLVKDILREEESGNITIYFDKTIYTTEFSDGKLNGEMFGQNIDRDTGCPYVSPLEDIQDYGIMQHLILIGCIDHNEHIIVARED